MTQRSAHYNPAQFALACETVRSAARGTKGIGTVSEKMLHAALKEYFEPFADSQEVKIGAFVADIVGEEGIIEIQTRSFTRLCKKLEAFLSVAEVTVVYPIAHTKWLYWIDPDTGTVSAPRKSPKTGTPCDAFYELYAIKAFLAHAHLRVVLALVDVEEYRCRNGYGRDKKRGSTRIERIPTALVDEIELCCKSDYAALLPVALPAEFTVKAFARAARLSPRSAARAVTVLRELGAITFIRKEKNAFIYCRAADA